MNAFTKTLSTLALFGMLTACGGGGGSTPGSTVSPASAQTTKSSATKPRAVTQPTRTTTPAPTGNRAPTLGGTPRAAVTVGKEYRFKPSAYDADGDTLYFTVRNAPGWLAFNPADGSLVGTPTAADIGTDNNISITVSDGSRSTSIGPFSIVVRKATTQSRQSKKYNPGHYIDLLRYQTTGNQSEKIITDAMRPGVTGVQVRYYWRDLETSPGVYDFSRIQRDLQLLSSQGLHLIVNPADKTFKNEQPVPDYLAKYVLRNRKGGYTVQRWKPYVVDRWVALVEALGKRFDGNPYFEGIATEESAPGVDDAVLTKNGYTPENYRDALIDLLQRTADAFPTSRVFWYMNFLPMRQDYIAQIADAVAPAGVAMGGPDILPDDRSIADLAYPFYDEFQDTMPLFCVAMPDSYKHAHANKSARTKYWTMQELFEYGRDQLHLNYMLWTNVPNSSKAYDTLDAYPVIERNPVINY